MTGEGSMVCYFLIAEYLCLRIQRESPEIQWSTRLCYTWSLGLCLPATQDLPQNYGELIPRTLLVPSFHQVIIRLTTEK